ncbi:alpha/beta hydrolase [Methylobacterium sp. AMS5]|uniref:alpha/beta fold hydrolase n=1 Tax=Methylobacterium sp. AMS5 TaxID=925818 RepID=UPI00074F85DF|nr:alpha/beta hydrolase [Methylobacterium sp. AMS5]AMB43951.1 alpha/beta hydrolase [Methylobacterium sp. AMS5]
MTTLLHTATTPLLDIAYEVGGPPDGFPVLLLHGWPDDIRTWDAIVPTLHAAGFRTFAPYLRGFGPTRFRGADIPRSGQLAALGADLLDLADALNLDRFAVVGHDWGARASYIAACTAPERIVACVALSVGWGTNDPGQTLTLNQTQNYWYHWLMALPRGDALVRDDRHRFTRHIWTIWNPGWRVPDAAFSTTAAAFDNPDWADVTLHSYRVRWGHAEPDPRYATLEAQLAADPVIQVPTLTLHGGADPCNDPATSKDRDALFAAFYRRIVLPNLGHFPQRQAPEAVLKEVLPFLMQAVGREGSASRVGRCMTHADGATRRSCSKSPASCR